MEKRVCPVSGQEFTISDLEIDLCEKLHVPLPLLSPVERLRQLTATRNERRLYHRTCDATQQKIISNYPPDSPYVIYKNDVWWGDGWDALDYGQPIDFARPFFDQFFELQQKVPREGTSIFRSENCDFNSQVRDSRNCYMNWLAVNGEDVYYSYWCVNNKDLVDCSYMNDCELCFVCLDVNGSYDCIMVQESSNCSGCLFGSQLRGCKNCILCTNLVNAQNCIGNQPCTPEEYAAKRREILNGSWRTFTETRARFQELQKQSVQRAVHTLQCENVRGDHLYQCRNCDACFDGSDNEDCAHVISLGGSKNICSSFSIGWPPCEEAYMCSMLRGSKKCAFCVYVWFSNDILYCDSCVSCSDCFGCIGLRHKQYCILNRQYTKDEYEALKTRLIDHMKTHGEYGSFFPTDRLPFAYNQTAAMDYYPLTKEEALARGFAWYDHPPEIPDVPRVIEADQLPDVRAVAEEEILKTAIRCQISGRPFRIIKQELDFYHRLGLPLPRLHPEERWKLRMSRRNPRTLWSRECANCQKPIETTSPADQGQVVYCEECYLKMIN